MHQAGGQSLHAVWSAALLPGVGCVIALVSMMLHCVSEALVTFSAVSQSIVLLLLISTACDHACLASKQCRVVKLISCRLHVSRVMYSVQKLIALELSAFFSIFLIGHQLP